VYSVVKSIQQGGVKMYIVIEMHGGPEYAIICMDTDGNNKVFDNIEDATKEAENCQDGFVLEV